MSLTRIICQVSDADQPGILARVTHAVAERGLSLGEVLARRTAEGPRIELSVQVDEQLCQWLIKRLQCDPAITTVSLG